MKTGSSAISAAPVRDDELATRSWRSQFQSSVRSSAVAAGRHQSLGEPATST